MMQEAVHDPETETRLYGLLTTDPNRIWSISALARELDVPRLRVERAALVLQVLKKVVIEKPVGNALIVRLPPAAETRRPKDP